MFNKKRATLRIQKRRMLMLEVLIAFSLVLICLLPIIAPHMIMLKEQKKAISTVKLDNFVHLCYVDVLQQLQENKIGWKDIQEGSEIAINEGMLSRIAYPDPVTWQGKFKFRTKKSHPNKTKTWTKYLLELIFTFQTPPANEISTFTYQVFLLRNAPVVESPGEDTEQATQQEKKSKKEERNSKKSKAKEGS